MTWIHPSIECTVPLYSIASLLAELVYMIITYNLPQSVHCEEELGIVPLDV